MAFLFYFIFLFEHILFLEIPVNFLKIFKVHGHFWIILNANKVFEWLSSKIYRFSCGAMHLFYVFFVSRYFLRDSRPELFLCPKILRKLYGPSFVAKNLSLLLLFFVPSNIVNSLLIIVSFIFIYFFFMFWLIYLHLLIFYLYL